MRKLLFILFTIHLSLFTATAQTIKNGSRWWDGERLYTATVDEAGNVKMNGESVDMGGDSFLLIHLLLPILMGGFSSVVKLAGG